MLFLYIGNHLFLWYTNISPAKREMNLVSINIVHTGFLQDFSKSKQIMHILLIILSLTVCNWWMRIDKLYKYTYMESPKIVLKNISSHLQLNWQHIHTITESIWLPQIIHKISLKIINFIAKTTNNISGNVYIYI